MLGKIPFPPDLYQKTGGIMRSSINPKMNMISHFNNKPVKVNHDDDISKLSCSFKKKVSTSDVQNSVRSNSNSSIGSKNNIKK